MGVEYALFKIGKPERFDLGKPTGRMPDETGMADLKIKDPIAEWAEFHALLDPSDTAMWRIGTDDGTARPFDPMKRWTREGLALLIEKACLRDDDIKMAEGLADDLITWAGSDMLVLSPDGLEEEIAGRLGLDFSMHVETGSVYGRGGDERKS